VVGVGVIIAEVGAELEEEQLDRIAEFAAALEVFVAHAVDLLNVSRALAVSGVRQLVVMSSLAKRLSGMREMRATFAFDSAVPHASVDRDEAVAADARCR
jgi:hypothetical protein